MSARAAGPSSRPRLLGRLVLVVAASVATGLLAGAALARADVRAAALAALCLAAALLLVRWCRRAAAPEVVAVEQAAQRDRRPAAPAAPPDRRPGLEQAVSSAAHELGNVLANVVGHVDLMLVEPGSRREELEEIRRAALNGRDAIRRLKDCAEGARGADPAAAWPDGAGAPALPDRSAILVIEDDPLIGETVGALLRHLGHEAEIAGSGQAGIERYRGRRFDCVITDLMMPDLSGLTVSRAIVDHDPGARVILLTGGGDPVDMDHSRAAGVSQVIMKPVTVDDLMQIFGSRRPAAAPAAAREASWARS